MKYKTNNLDLAAYLLTKNQQPIKIKYLTDIYGEFIFEKTKTLTDAVERFQKGRVEVNLTNYIYHRLELKKQLKKEADYKKQITIKKYARKTDTIFWYIDENNKIQHATYDPNNPLHKKYRDEGNFFENSVDAAKARATL
mgnify:CR=1 FL=1